MLMVSCLVYPAFLPPTICCRLPSAFCLLPTVDCLLPTAFCLPRPYTRGPCGGRGGIAESRSFRTPMTINKTGQVLLMPHSGTNSSIRKMTPIVIRMTGPVKLILLEIGVLGGLPILYCSSPFWPATHQPFPQPNRLPPLLHLFQLQFQLAHLALVLHLLQAQPLVGLHLQIANLHQLYDRDDYHRHGEACKGNDEWRIHGPFTSPPSQ